MAKVIVVLEHNKNRVSVGLMPKTLIVERVVIVPIRGYIDPVPVSVPEHQPGIPNGRVIKINAESRVDVPTIVIYLEPMLTNRRDDELHAVIEEPVREMLLALAHDYLTSLHGMVMLSNSSSISTLSVKTL